MLLVSLLRIRVLHSVSFSQLRMCGEQCSFYRQSAKYKVDNLLPYRISKPFEDGAVDQASGKHLRKPFCL
jgi:hypothetical protein